MKNIFFTPVIILLFVCSYAFSQDTLPECHVQNRTFFPGEKYSYIISYNWFIVFSEVGEVTFSIEEDEIFDQKAFHFVADGKTFNWWDKFFKVRDRYEVWVKQDNLRPLFFQRNTREGNWRQHESYTFKEDSLIYRKTRVKDKPMRYDTLQINSCTWDIMSSLLYTRNFDYSGYEVGEKIPISVALDQDIYDLYFRYLGVEEIKVKGIGTFECMKFTILLVEGTMFHEGEDMFLWVTNDKNQIPIYVESPILIGSIKARIYSIEGNRYPLTSKIE